MENLPIELWTIILPYIGNNISYIRKVSKKYNDIWQHAIIYTFYCIPNLDTNLRHMADNSLNKTLALSLAIQFIYNNNYNTFITRIFENKDTLKVYNKKTNSKTIIQTLPKFVLLVKKLLCMKLNYNPYKKELKYNDSFNQCYDLITYFIQTKGIYNIRWDLMSNDYKTMLANDIEFTKPILRKHPMYLEYIAYSNMDIEFAIELATIQPACIKYMNSTIKSNKVIIEIILDNYLFADFPNDQTIIENKIVDYIKKIENILNTKPTHSSTRCFEEIGKMNELVSITNYKFKLMPENKEKIDYYFRKLVYYDREVAYLQQVYHQETGYMYD